MKYCGGVETEVTVSTHNRHFREISLSDDLKNFLASVRQSALPAVPGPDPSVIDLFCPCYLFAKIYKVL